MNRILRSAMLSALVLLVAVPAVAGTWVIDTSHSVMNFKVRHIFSKAGGQFGEWGGTLEFDGSDPGSLAANVTIQTASIDTDNENRDEHLRSADFFNVEQFPTMSLRSTVSSRPSGRPMAGRRTHRPRRASTGFRDWNKRCAATTPPSVKPFRPTSVTGRMKRPCCSSNSWASRESAMHAAICDAGCARSDARSPGGAARGARRSAASHLESSA